MPKVSQFTVYGTVYSVILRIRYLDVKGYELATDMLQASISPVIKMLLETPLDSLTNRQGQAQSIKTVFSRPINDQDIATIKDQLLGDKTYEIPAKEFGSRVHKGTD